jgi:hypothetical protein
MCLIILTLYVILDLVRSFEMSGYVYSMRYGDILEQRNVRISCYLYIYIYTDDIVAPRIFMQVYKEVQVLPLIWKLPDIILKFAIRVVCI